MSQLLLPDLEESTLQRLHERAVDHGRTAEAEAKAILVEALRSTTHESWTPVNAIRERLAASGRHFEDSTNLIREDRER